jgi:hypothetical protein
VHLFVHSNFKWVSIILTNTTRNEPSLGDRVQVVLLRPACAEAEGPLHELSVEFESFGVHFATSTSYAVKVVEIQESMDRRVSLLPRNQVPKF